METSSTDTFLAGAPVLADFGQIVDPDLYAPLPSDWTIGLADVVRSTDAIMTGQYKAVNMAGAAVIAALSNAVGQARFPYVFGGDGASFAVPPAWTDAARTALAETARLVEEEFGLTLRVAMVPIGAIREAGLDVRIARFAVSPHLDQTMFSGGGLAWAEGMMKAGRFAVAPAPPGSRPDLSGLSCRFEQSPSQRGLILSIIVRPTGVDTAGYRALMADLLHRIETSPGMARPVPETGPPLGWPPPGLRLEAKATRRKGGSDRMHRTGLLLRSAIVFLSIRFRIRLGAFDPGLYMRQLVANSDYRKYDDGLRMTIDCKPDLADAIEGRLWMAEHDGIARVGLHRQGAALMTCITHSALRSDHIHFVDGAEGGYAAAAAGMKTVAPG